MTALLICLTNEEGVARLSRSTLAAWCGLSGTQAVDESIKRLLEHSWITVESGKKSFNSNHYAVQWWALPKGRLTQRVVTNEARQLAGWYKNEVDNLPKKLSKSGRMYRPPVGNNWQARWQYVMQSWLDEGHTAEQIKQVCSFVFTQERDLARRGPQTLKRGFDRFLQDSTPKQ